MSNEILIVDDNQVMRTLVRRSLDQGSFPNLIIIEAANGLDALEQFHTHKLDLILSDWNMPKMDGLSFLQAIRKENQLIPFGFITAQNNSKLRRKAKQFGAHFVLSKPFNPEKLNETIRSILT